MQTKILAEFALALTYQDLPARAVTMAKQCVQDLIGVALAGSATEQGRIWHTYFSRRTDGLQAAAWMPGFPRLAWREAAALNAACGHLLDMDDVHSGSITHLGVITIPAALAAGSAFHRSGREVIAAIAAGYEVGARVGEAVNPGAYHYWHTTGVVGALATAAAVGKLLGLDDDQYLSAFGSAGTQAAGLWEFLPDGAMSKPLHTANATLCGIRAAELAQLGLTGAGRILEGPRGLVRALSPTPELSMLTADLDTQRLRILENAFKPYACCRHLHAACQALEELAAGGCLRPEDICAIRDNTYAVAKDTIDCPAPETPYAGKFSAQYTLPALLCTGELTESSFSKETLANPALRRLMSRVTVTVDPKLEMVFQKDPTCWPHRLEIVMKDGRVLEKTVYFPPGDPRNPFSQKECDEKFQKMTVLLPIEARERLLCKLHALEQLEDVSSLFTAV